MGDPHQFRTLFPTQSNPVMNDTDNATLSQESSSFQVPQNVFSSAGHKPIFGSLPQNADAGGLKNIFGSPTFSKPAEMPSSVPSGSAYSVAASQPLTAPNSEGHSNIPQASFFGKPHPLFGGVPAKPDATAPPTVSSIFGGAGTAQNVDRNCNPFVDIAPSTLQPPSNTKPSIFGGSNWKKEDPSSKPGFSLFSNAQYSDVDGGSLDKSRNIVFKNVPGESTKVSFGDQPSTAAPNKQSPFLSQNSTFGGFSSPSGMVGSNSLDQARGKTESVSNNREVLVSPSKSAMDQRDLRIKEDENRDKYRADPLAGSLRSTKVVRKHGVFGKAIEDVTKLSSRKDNLGNVPAEETRSIVCHPLSGDLPDLSVLKDFFSNFGVARVTLNKERRYAIATYKTHEEAVKAMKAGHVIKGVKCKVFWRNLAKVRRRSAEEGEKIKAPQEKSRISRRSEVDVDPSVREELEAISGVDYFTHEEASSKRKLGLEPDKQRSHNFGKGSVELDEVKIDGPEKRKRDKDRTLRSDASKSGGVRALKEIRTDQKPSLRSNKVVERLNTKISLNSQDKNDPERLKTEKVESSAMDSSIAPSAATSELLEILKQQAVSSDDKLRVLEARDKLMRLRKVKQYDISKAVKTVGTCPDMCPEKERLLRETRRQVAQYEMKGNEMDPSLMVKQYSRSSADQEEPLPHELRPPTVLTMTMNYLMHNIMSLGDQPGENLGEWYHFLWDRLRGIRKEITQQELCDLDAVNLVEQCARFHIHCGARLVAEDMSVFDDRINTENLTKCLQTLKHMYQDLWMNNSITCPNEPEFVTYFLLLNLNNGTIMWEMEQLREEVLKSPEIGFVATMYNSLSSNNFVRFFRLVRKASYLNSCLCIRYFYQVRAKALATLVKALAKIRPVQYPLSNLIEELGFENVENAATFCGHYGLTVENNSSACVVLSQETFSNPSFVLPSERAFRLAESKKIGSVGDVVNGGSLPPRMFDTHKVHHSFDENGYLHKNAFYPKVQGVTDLEIKDVEEDLCSKDTNQVSYQQTQQETSSTAPNAIEEGQNDRHPLSKSIPISFGGFGNQNLIFPSTFSSAQPGNSGSFSAPSTKVFQSPFSSSTTPQPALERQDNLRDPTAQLPEKFEPLKGLVYRNVFVDQNQAEIEARKRAQAELDAQKRALDAQKRALDAQKRAQAELEATINEEAEVQLQELMQSGIQEGTAEVALLEMKAAEEEHFAQERLRAEEQLRAQEELRKRVLDAHVDRISKDSVLELVSEVVTQLVVDSVQQAYLDEKKLVADINLVSEECLRSLLYLVVEEYCCNIALEELKIAQEKARRQAVQKRVKLIFYQWLQRARRSLHRRRVMEDFPAGVIPLSLKEHAERWGFSSNVEDVYVKQKDKILDLPELKAVPAYSQITFADLVGIQAVHRYDSVRIKMGLRPTDKLLYKLFISVPEESEDPAAQLLDWWIRRTFKPNCGILHDDVRKGVYRVVSGTKVTSEVAVYASLQMIRGNDPLEKHIGLASGTCAVLFTVSPSSDIPSSKSRLNNLLKSVQKLPAMPLVVAVICPLEPPLEGLKQLVTELELDHWLSLGVITDYQILHIAEQFDLKYFMERFNMALNYMVMTWIPCPEFSLVCLKNVLKSTFQMFYISIQFNYNSSEVYPQNIEDPRIIIGLCNEWLDLMCKEFVDSYSKAKDLCAEEFWPLLHKGAYLPFLNNPRYVELLQEVMKLVSLPPMDWPPTSEREFENLFERYCSWLRPNERKQTERRLSCLNGLTWSEKIKSMPWVNLIEDWMEARINYIETSVICGSELLCLMRTQNVEHLYTYPWWAQSKHILSYLETYGSGRENDMDVDQSGAFEIPETEVTEGLPIEVVQKQTECKSGLSHLQEVTGCVNKLNSVNESLLIRLRSALADSVGDLSVSTNGYKRGNESEKSTENSTATAPQDLKSLLSTINLEVQAQRDQRNHISKILSSALSEESVNSASKLMEATRSVGETVPRLSTVEPFSDQSALKQGISEEKVSKSSNRMDDIMASVNDIITSLNQKYKILDGVSNFEKITDLKMGLGKIDSYSTLLSSQELLSSPFIEQSKRRMQERLQGSVLRPNEGHGRGNSHPSDVDSDSDLDVLSDGRSASTVVRSFSSPSSLDRESYKSKSEADEEDDVYGDVDSRDGKGYRYRSEISKKTRRYSDASDDDEGCSSKKRFHHDDRDDASSCESEKSDEDGECVSLDDDDDEVQSISSEDSRGGTKSDTNIKSSITPNNCYYGSGKNEPSLNPIGFGDAQLSPNEDGSEATLLNLDSVGNQYEYFVEGNRDAESHVYTESSEIGVFHADGTGEIFQANNDASHASGGEDHIFLPGYSLDIHGTFGEPLERVYEISTDRDNVNVNRQSEGTDHTISEGDDQFIQSTTKPMTSTVKKYEDSDSDIEALEDVEEEEDEEDGEKVENDNNDFDEVEEEDDGKSEEECDEDKSDEEECDEDEAGEEEYGEVEEEELETEEESEPDEDSDVCEVIDN